MARAQTRKLFFLIIDGFTVEGKSSEWLFFILWDSLYKWTARKNTCSRLCWPVERLALWLTPSVVASVIHTLHTTPFSLTLSHTHRPAHWQSSLVSLFISQGNAKIHSYVANNSWKMTKCSLESTNEWIRYLGLVQKSGHCLHVWGMREGRREHLPMSLPSLECSWAAHLVWADIRAGAGRTSSRVSCCFQAARLESCSRRGPCLKKWGLWNDRSPLRLSQRAGESKGLKEVGGWDCVPIARGFPVIFWEADLRGISLSM